MQTVKFRLVYENFQPGDVAKFPEDEAFELHEAGFAEFVEAPAKPEKKAESKAKKKE